MLKSGNFWYYIYSSYWSTWSHFLSAITWICQNFFLTSIILKCRLTKLNITSANSTLQTETKSDKFYEENLQRLFGTESKVVSTVITRRSALLSPPLKRKALEVLLCFIQIPFNFSSCCTLSLSTFLWSDFFDNHKYGFYFDIALKDLLRPMYISVFLF